MNSQYPDVVALFQQVLQQNKDLKSFIIDAEIVAIDPKTGSTRSFQDLSNRARKAVQLREIQVFVAVFVFDLMFLNGEVNLVERASSKRDSLPLIFP